MGQNVPYTTQCEISSTALKLTTIPNSFSMVSTSTFYYFNSYAHVTECFVFSFAVPSEGHH